MVVSVKLVEATEKATELVAAFELSSSLHEVKAIVIAERNKMKLFFMIVNIN